MLVSNLSWDQGPTMLNPTNGDPSHVIVNYVEEYLDLVESLPFDLQRSVSIMKEIDAKYQGKLKTKQKHFSLSHPANHTHTSSF